MTKTDVYLGLAFILLSIYLFLHPFFYEYPSFPSDPGPALLPIVTSLLLFILSTFLIVTSIKKDKNKTDKDDLNGQTLVTKKGIKNFLMTSFFLIIYILLMYIFGFIISSIIFMIVTITYLDKSFSIKSVVINFITSFIVVFAIYYIFILLKIPLFSGII